MVEDVHERIMHDLNELVVWSKHNCRPLNVDKCLVLHYNSRLQPNPCNNYFINDVSFSGSHICTDLSLTRTGDGHYYEHIATICARASRRI